MRRTLLIAAVGVMAYPLGACAHLPPATAPVQAPRYTVRTVDTLATKAPAALLAVLDSTLVGLRARAGCCDSLQQVIDASRAAIATLLDSWKRVPASQKTAFASEQLRRSFAYDIALLRAVRADSNPTNLAWVLSNARDDIVEKSDHCRLSPSGWATDVHVMVRTWQGDAQADHWQVFYLPKLLEAATDQANYTTPFQTFSSPAVADLPPGRYVMWAQKPGSQQMSDRVTIRVGRGATQLTQDIAVPR